MDLKPIPSALQSGLNGYQQAQRDLAETANNIANLNVENEGVAGQEAVNVVNARPEVDLTTEAVNLVVNEHLAKANVKVIQTADEVVGTLIDTKV